MYKPGQLWTTLANHSSPTAQQDFAQALLSRGNMGSLRRERERSGIWHSRCSLAGTSNHLREQIMKMLLATMFKKVPVRQTKQRATICKRCGVRIYSLSYLKAHLEAHCRKAH
jgi:hypothetical protein